MLRLTVVTPERAFLDEECLSVTLPGRIGELQVLQGHVPSLVELKTGCVEYEKANHERVRFMIAQGFAEIEASHVNLLCEIARHKAEVDKVSEQALQKKLRDQMQELSQDEEGLRILTADLEKSIASLNLLE